MGTRPKKGPMHIYALEVDDSEPGLLHVTYDAAVPVLVRFFASDEFLLGAALLPVTQGVQTVDVQSPLPDDTPIGRIEIAVYAEERET
jgi:hypothetical protein